MVKRDFALAFLVLLFWAFLGFSQVEAAGFPSQQAAEEKVHIVVKGDTLWKLAAQYLGDPTLWKLIWEANPELTEPNRLVVGQKLVIPSPPKPPAPPEEKVVPPEKPEEEIVTPEKPEEEMAPPAKEVEAPPPPRITRPPVALEPVANQTDMYCAEIVLPKSGGHEIQIVGAEEAGTVGLAEGDIVYLNQGSAFGLRPGDQLAVLRDERSIIHPKTGGKLGVAVSQLGVVQVLVTETNSAIARVISSCAVIELNDWLRPFVQVPVPLSAKIPPPEKFVPIAEGDTIGYIVSVKDDMVNFGEGNIVNIDLGKEDGVAPGDIYYIFRGATEQKIAIILGQLVVLMVEEKTATGKVIYSLQELEVGDQVMKKH
ncbi:MAG: LysM peptidoglycan-binding domain-containing protein [Acidobacteriota bacterium]